MQITIEKGRKSLKLSLNKKHLRILHIGNIANNAYLNAKILNEAGFECDVLCASYYHSMGNPEWEDADFEGVIKDQAEDKDSGHPHQLAERVKIVDGGPLVTISEAYH